MENYNRSCSCSCGGSRTNTCYCIVLSIIGALLAFVIGLIVGISATQALATYFTALVAIAIALGVMFIVFLVLRFCQPKSNRNC